MMKANKTIINLVLCGAIAFSMAGCSTTTNQNPAQANEENKNLQVSSNVNVSSSNQINNQYETVGKIVDFGENGVHVLTGDMVKIFKVDKDSIQNFYIGETVGVKKMDENKFELERSKVNDFAVRHTNMGHIISTVSGNIKEVNGNKFIIATKDGDMEFESYDELSLKKGADVTVDYSELHSESKEKIFIDIYDEASKLNLTIKNVSRSENGMMLLDTEDINGMKYEIYITKKSILNFNHSDLKASDKVIVYPEVIKETDPAQVNAKMIKKQS